MRPERAGQIMAGMLVSLARWEEELAAIPTAAAGDVPKHHLMSSLRQTRVSLSQLIARDSTE